MSGEPLERTAATPPFWRRELRLHPCIGPVLVYGLSLACAMVVAAVASTPVPGAALGLGSAIMLALPVIAITRGQPRLSHPEAQRLASAMGAIDRDPAWLETPVIVQDDLQTPCKIRRKPSIVFAASSFVRALDEDTLRGVSALQLSELRNPDMAKYGKRFGVVRGALFVATVITASLFTPFHYYLVFTVIGSVGFSTWLYVAIASAFSRTSTVSNAYARVDVVAARIAGARTTATALRAMAAWRLENRVATSSLWRALTRCAQPIPPDWHEADRADRLDEHAPDRTR